MKLKKKRKITTFSNRHVILELLTFPVFKQVQQQISKQQPPNSNLCEQRPEKRRKEIYSGDSSREL